MATTIHTTIGGGFYGVAFRADFNNRDEEDTKEQLKSWMEFSKEVDDYFARELKRIG